MQLSNQDQLRVWRLLLRNNLVGKIAPAHPRDLRPTEYALLVPDANAVAEVNAILLLLKKASGELRFVALPLG
jgi:hypothetical protein